MIIAECAVYTKLLNDLLKVEYMKSKTRGLTDTEKEEFANDDTRRFLHFTSKENAEKIMKSGFVIPTKGVIQNHFTRKLEGDGRHKNMEAVYMFDNKTLNIEDYIRNLPNKRSPYNGCFEYYAVSTRPNKHEIENFQKRAQDGAILYDGRMDIDGTDTKLTKFVLDLDKDGKYMFNEVPLDFEYTPSDILQQKLAQEKQGKVEYTAKLLLSEIKKGKKSLKKYKLEKDEYKGYINKKKEFARANKQFKEEEKEKSYIFKYNGRTMMVKNLEYDLVDGKKLQKIAMIENSDNAKGKDIMEATKIAFMDECDLSKLEPEMAKKYFFNNYDNISRNSMKLPEYIGLPEQDINTGEIVNEYDDGFKNHYKEKVQRTEQADKNYGEYKNSKKISAKIKSFFSKMFGKKKDVKLLESKQAKEQKKQHEIANSETKEKTSLLDKLKEKTYTKEQVTAYDIKNLSENKVKTKESISKEKSIG